jgi:ABC-type uncharacterized transport system permease subunit
MDLGILAIALVGGALRVSVPYLLVSLGECLTEKAGRINLGQEGTLMLGAMGAYAVSLASGSPWLGVVAAAGIGLGMGLAHAGLCALPRVNDIAVGIAMTLFGSGLAFFLGKSLIQPVAPRLDALPLGGLFSDQALRSSLDVNPLLILGAVVAVVMAWVFASTRWGLILRLVGENSEAARTLGHRPGLVRALACGAGGALAGIGGASLSLFYPGSWNERLSSGQGLMAVALVIFARWRPMACLWASLLFGAAGALSPALQAAGVSGAYHLTAAAPYLLTLGLLVAASSPRRAMGGMPQELMRAR